MILSEDKRLAAVEDFNIALAKLSAVEPDEHGEIPVPKDQFLDLMRTVRDLLAVL